MIDLSWLELLIAVVLPLVVAVVTREVRSSGLKAVALAALAAVSAALTAVVANDGVLTEATLQAGVEYFLIAVASYYGLWKPTGVAPAVQQKTDAVHIGL
jgi:hypothetical protein